jgi:DNA replication protein DnaC
MAERAARLPSESSSARPSPDGEYVGLRQDREARERVDRLVKESGVPARYAGATPDDLYAVPAAEAAAYAVKLDRLRSLVRGPCIVALVGPRGTGKTWMACAIVNATCRGGRRARYADATDYFLQLKATYGPTAKEDQTAVEARFLAPAVLVLDEMHERGDTAWEDRMLTRLVNKRYADCKATVLVSNDDPAAFADRVGASIADRINDDGAMIVCQWPSLRGRIGGRDHEG